MSRTVCEPSGPGSKRCKSFAFIHKDVVGMNWNEAVMSLSELLRSNHVNISRGFPAALMPVVSLACTGNGKRVWA